MKESSYAMALGLFSSLTMFVFYAYKTPLQKTLYLELVKSSIVGGLLGLGYFKMQNYWFNEKVHKVYVLT